MLEDPGIDASELAAALSDGYGIRASAFTFVPGYDMQAASYRVTAARDRWFAKVRFGPVAEVPLEVPRALLDAGVENVLAPVRSVDGALWHDLGAGRTLVVHPFVAGRNAMNAGMTEAQWRTFGVAMRAVHDSGLDRQFAGRLRAETFALPSAAKARRGLELQPTMASTAADGLRADLVARARQIEAMIARAEELGAGLGVRPLERVLCHADIHAANVLVADDGRVFLVDWDGPMLAPREHDLLFVIGSRIARRVEPHEEAWFFQGYGPVAVDPEALVYYRYERIIEDIGEIAESVLSGDIPEASRGTQVALFESFFAPGGIIESAESVRLPGD